MAREDDRLTWVPPPIQTGSRGVTLRTPELPALLPIPLSGGKGLRVQRHGTSLSGLRILTLILDPLQAGLLPREYPRSGEFIWHPPIGQRSGPLSRMERS